MSKHVQTNMSKLVQIWYDTNCHNSYDSQTCEHVQTCQYYCKTCLDLSYTIKWQNSLKFEQTAERKFRRQSDSLDGFEKVERSKIAEFACRQLL